MATLTPQEAKRLYSIHGSHRKAAEAAGTSLGTFQRRLRAYDEKLADDWCEVNGGGEVTSDQITEMQRRGYERMFPDRPALAPSYGFTDRGEELDRSAIERETWQAAQRATDLEMLETIVDAEPADHYQQEAQALYEADARTVEIQGTAGGVAAPVVQEMTRVVAEAFVLKEAHIAGRSEAQHITATEVRARQQEAIAGLAKRYVTMQRFLSALAAKVMLRAAIYGRTHKIGPGTRSVLTMHREIARGNERNARRGCDVTGRRI